MSGKSGRLTFSGRNEYIITVVYGVLAKSSEGFAAGGVGYAAKCTCALGDHYLAYDATGALVERTSDRGAVPDECIFPTYAAIDALLETWQRQHQQRQAESSESEAE